MKKFTVFFAMIFLLSGFTTQFEGTPLVAHMTGAQEAPVPGDPDASGFFEITLNQGQGTLTYELTVQNIDPATAAHIHIAPVGHPGPVVIPLAPPTNGFSSGVITNLSKELIKDIRQNPEKYYVNVHNQPYPGGAVRGQLSRK